MKNGARLALKIGIVAGFLFLAAMAEAKNMSNARYRKVETLEPDPTPAQALGLFTDGKLETPPDPKPPAPRTGLPWWVIALAAIAAATALAAIFA